jgi:chromosome segregation ATPase
MTLLYALATVSQHSTKSFQMDPLSVTASVVAVIQISNAVLLSCYRLQSKIKDAEKEIAQIVSEVEDLASILDDLKHILGQLDSDLPDLSSPLLSCLAILEELQQKLAPLAKPGLKHKLFWPFESKGIQRKLEIIQKQKSTLQLALSGYQTRLLVYQATNITGIQSSALEIEATVREVKDSVSKLTVQLKQQAILDW